jgi:hypothetical protein
MPHDRFDVFKRLRRVPAVSFLYTLYQSERIAQRSEKTYVTCFANGQRIVNHLFKHGVSDITQLERGRLPSQRFPIENMRFTIDSLGVNGFIMGFCLPAFFVFINQLL